MNAKPWLNVVAICTLLMIGASAWAEEMSPEKNLKPIPLTDFTADLDGREVTVRFEVDFTQHIGGEREGEFPTLKLHHVRKAPNDFVIIYAKGDLADILHRMDLSTKDRLKGRSITATGKVRAYEGIDESGAKEPVYLLELRDWKKFQVARTE